MNVPDDINPFAWRACRCGRAGNRLARRRVNSLSGGPCGRSLPTWCRFDELFGHRRRHGGCSAVAATAAATRGTTTARVAAAAIHHGTIAHRAHVGATTALLGRIAATGFRSTAGGGRGRIVHWLGLGHHLRHRRGHVLWHHRGGQRRNRGICWRAGRRHISRRRTGRCRQRGGIGRRRAQYAPRLNQLQGQSGHNCALQQPDTAGSAATASRISIFFIFCVSSQSSWGITAWVASSDDPIQTLRAGPRSGAALWLAICTVAFCQPTAASRSIRILLVPGGRDGRLSNSTSQRMMCNRTR